MATYLGYSVLFAITGHVHSVCAWRCEACINMEYDRGMSMATDVPASSFGLHTSCECAHTNGQRIASPSNDVCIQKQGG